MFAKPPVGSAVVVTTETPSYYIYRTSENDAREYQGRVIKSEHYDAPNTFRMSGDSRTPIRVISLHRVTKLTIDGKAKASTDPAIQEKTVVVKGSKGNEYVVTVHANGTGSCTCPAAVYRRMQCKHIKEVLSKNC